MGYVCVAPEIKSKCPNKNPRIEVKYNMDPLWLAMSKFRRGKLAECISICDELLNTNSKDESAWYLKCKAIIQQNYIDDIELDEEGVAEMILDENAIASMPRPGTSLNRPQSSAKGAGYDQGLRPVSSSGRPLTGFIRPGSSRPMSGSTSLRDALQSSRGSTASGARPMTSLGREVRLSTASLNSSNGKLVDVDKLNLKKYAHKPNHAVILTEYLLYVEHNTRKALELCAEATKATNFKNWFWKARLGKCYYKLGLLRDAEKQFKSSIKDQPTISTYLELCNVYLRLDIPNTAIDLLMEAKEKFTLEPRIILGIARIYDMLNNQEKAVIYYRTVLSIDATNIEAIACLGAHYFYCDQPELSIRYYRRLIQMGVSNCELWNNLGLCCFYSGQYDMTLGCFERALQVADDSSMADVWYNIGHVGIALGDLGLAYQAFKVTVSIEPNHGEALNNIAVLEMRRQKFDSARACLSSSLSIGKHLFEPCYNNGLLAYRQNEYLDASANIDAALKLYPDHIDSKEVKSLLQKLFTT